MLRDDVVVIGAGLAGLVASYRAATTGRTVRLLAKGAGSLTLASGCLDVLGYEPHIEVQPATAGPIGDLQPALERLIGDQPEHPLALAGLEQLAQGLEVIRSLARSAGLDYIGSLESNWWLPSTIGGLRPTCLAPASFVAGDLADPDPMLIVGFRELRDFYPEYVAANLRYWTERLQEHSLDLPITDAQGLTLSLPSTTFTQNVTPVEVARLLDRPAFRVEIARQIRPHLGRARRVGFPAVLGLADVNTVVADLSHRLGVPVFEIPTLPPSVPGLRLYQAISHTLTTLGVAIQIGRRVLTGAIHAGHVTSVQMETAGHPLTYQAGHYILATGGLLAGGLETHEDGQIAEPVFGLPVQAPAQRADWFRPSYLDPAGHPLQRSGVRVDAHMRPVDQADQPLADNLTIAGATLAGFDWPLERSGDGVAVATGYVAAGG